MERSAPNASLDVAAELQDDEKEHQSISDVSRRYDDVYSAQYVQYASI